MATRVDKSKMSCNRKVMDIIIVQQRAKVLKLDTSAVLQMIN